MTKTNKIRLFLAALVLAGGASAYYALRPQAPTDLPEPPPASEPAPSDPAPSDPTLSDPALSDMPADESGDGYAEGDIVDGLPVGKLIVTAERKAYEDASLTLYIPAIEISRTVYDGTGAEVLGKGVGLYDYAQLPGEGNRNVSLAGHRNGRTNGKVTDRAPFYYIDTLSEGDYLYLSDSDHIYRYLWSECFIIEPDDWSVIYTTGYSCLTLTSCHPIGISDHRIVVRALLDGVFDYDKEFTYLSSALEAKEDDA